MTPKKGKTLTKDITYGKKEIGKTENKLVRGNFISSCLQNLLVICQLKVNGFEHLLIHEKQIKDRIYTTMGGAPTISVLVYTLFINSPELKL